MEELAGFRRQAGRAPAPDLDEEAVLRVKLAAISAERQAISDQLDTLSSAVLNLAHELPEGAASGSDSDSTAERARQV